MHTPPLPSHYTLRANHTNQYKELGTVTLRVKIVRGWIPLKARTTPPFDCYNNTASLIIAALQCCQLETI